MSIDNLFAFLEKAEQDQSVGQQIADWKNSDLAVDSFCKQLVDLGQKHGFEFSTQDVEKICLAASTEGTEPMTEAELDAVAGGIKRIQPIRVPDLFDDDRFISRPNLDLLKKRVRLM